MLAALAEEQFSRVMSSKHLFARLLQPERAASSGAAAASSVLSPNETLQEQMSRITTLRINKPKYAQQLMQSGQALVSIAATGNGPVLMEALGKLRPVRLIVQFP